jgi:hypothetical protein
MNQLSGYNRLQGLISEVEDTFMVTAVNIYTLQNRKLHKGLGAEDFFFSL